MDSQGELTTKELILKSAEESFTLKGYVRSKIVDIARNAGVSEDLIFKYFESKEKLYLAVQRDEVKRIESDILKEVEHIKSPLETLLFLGKGLLEPDENTPKTIYSLSNTLRFSKAKSIMTLEEKNEFMDTILVPIIEEGQRVGEICDTNPNELARVYWRFMLGSLMSKHYFNINTPDTYLEIISKIFK